MIRFLLLMSLLGCYTFAGELLLMTENYPPYNYLEKVDGKEQIVGVSVDVVKALQSKVGDRSEIVMKLWREALELLETTPNSAVFAIARNPSRQKNFRLLGPIGEGTYVFYSLASKNIKVMNLEDAKKYKIGVYKDDICEQFLRAKGFTDILVAETDHFSLERLLGGEVDLWLVNDLKAMMVAKKKDIDFNKISGVFTAFVSPLYMAFNKAYDQKKYDKWLDALDKLRADGTLLKIKQKWADKLTEKLKDLR